MVGREENQKYPTVSEAAEEFIKLQDIAFPITTMGFVSYLKGLISVVCLGKLGQLELAGGSLAVGFTNITGYSVLSGLAMGMDPLCSQAFGSRNFPLLALTLQRTILVLLFASVPIGLLWINLEPLMLVLHQNAEITRVASIYCQFVLPDLIANSLLQPLKIYLRSKGNPWPLMWCHLLGVLLHLPITIFLTFNLNLGVPGIAMATFITNFNTLIFLLCYLFFCTGSSEEPLVTSMSLPSSSATTTTTTTTTTSSLTDEWGNLPLSTPLSSSPSSATSLGAEWGTLLRLAIPSCLGVCLEWWWYEFMTIASGYFHNPQVTLATSAIVIQTTALMYTFPSALSASVSTRVGSELGAGRPKKASLATKVAIVVAILVSSVGLLWTNLGRREWVSIFTQENDVRELTMAVLPIIGLCELANCPQTTGCGVLRGSARPDIGAIINFYSFYLVGAPVALILGFVLKLGFAGLCYGLLAAQIVCAVSIITVIWMTDWDKESLRAKELVGGGDSWTHEEEEDQSIKLVEETESLKEVIFQP